MRIENGGIGNGNGFGKCNTGGNSGFGCPEHDSGQEKREITAMRRRLFGVQGMPLNSSLWGCQ